MTLAQELAEYVRACFSGIFVETCEPDEALAEIGQLCRAENWRLASWNIESGLRISGPPAGGADAGVHDPLAAVRMAERLAAADGAGLMVLENLGRFFASVEIVQALAHQIQLGKRQRTLVVILAPIVELPRELEKLFVVIEHRLPDRAQLEQIAREIAAPKTSSLRTPSWPPCWTPPPGSRATRRRALLDPQERSNVAAKHADVVQQIEAIMADEHILDPNWRPTKNRPEAGKKTRRRAAA